MAPLSSAHSFSYWNLYISNHWIQWKELLDTASSNFIATFLVDVLGHCSATLEVSMFWAKCTFRARGCFHSKTNPSCRQFSDKEPSKK
jgi:hypothetical protein